MVFPTFFFKNAIYYVNIVTGLYRCTLDKGKKKKKIETTTLEQFRVIL